MTSLCPASAAPTRSAAWPTWSKLLGLGFKPQEETEAVTPGVWSRPFRNVWRPPVEASVQSSAELRPRAEEAIFQIQCVPLGGVEEVPVQVAAACERQVEAGRRLVSSFTHDGHVFLVFQRE